MHTSGNTCDPTSVSSPRARSGYTSAISTSGSSPTVAEMCSSGMRCNWNVEEAARAARVRRILDRCAPRPGSALV